MEPQLNNALIKHKCERRIIQENRKSFQAIHDIIYLVQGSKSDSKHILR